MPLADLSPGLSPALPSFQRQRLLADFSSLRHADLDGVLVSLTPGDASLWVGVMFVRKGPYAPAVLRFQISFPPAYPAFPPLVTFSTDVFHPLLTPLTTYTYTTGSSDTDTVSATDDERLPPGGFSLRHGFPRWFGRARRSAATSRDAGASAAGSPARSHTGAPAEAGAEGAGTPNATSPDKDVSMVAMLDYMRTTFSDAEVLDSVRLEAAANPGAYHAWRSYRAATKQTRDAARSLATSETQADAPSAVAEGAALGRNRRPGQWNWEGVWEERVKKAVKASLSEPVLYGGAAADDIIRFRDGDEEEVARMKKQLEAVLSRMVET